MSDEVLLRFRYEEQDFVHAMRLRIGRELRGRIDFMLGAVVILGGLILAYKLAPEWMWHVALFLVLLTMVGVAGVVLAGYLIMPRILFRSDPKNQTELTFEFSEAGISVRAGDKHASMKWGDYERYDHDAHSYVLYFADKGLTVIPRRAFRNERQESSFRRLIEQFVNTDE
jgi:hypothetical protein